MTAHPLSTPTPNASNEPQQLSSSRTQKGSTTEHTQKNGISYKAIADWMILRKKEKPIAEMFSVAYLKKDGDQNRPITFVFNGGPGAASAYLHVGALGPKRVEFGENGELLPPPTRLADNESTWLGFTDLIFIDPIGTGFSRTIDEEPPAGAKATEPKPEAKDNDEFFQLKRDLDSLGEFITRFLSKHGLWSRPVYIAGESYGGFRVGKLARHLQEGFGVGLCGAILISPALELTLLDGSDYDILMWSDLFPTLVASAHHHGRSRVFTKDVSLEKVLAGAEEFAAKDLIRVLALGGAMPVEERTRILARAADMMGLAAEFVISKGGRVSHMQFVRELLREERKVVGLYDSSITAIDPFPDREKYEGADPTLFAIERIFTTGINVQLREALGVQTDLEYHLLSMKVNNAWKVDTRRHAFETQIGATDDLRYAMSLNPYMKVYVCHGYFDLVTPYYSSNRLAGLMKLTPDQEKKLWIQHFRGGHMFYAWKESRTEFKNSVERFYAEKLS